MESRFYNCLGDRCDTENVKEGGNLLDRRPPAKGLGCQVVNGGYCRGTQAPFNPSSLHGSNNPCAIGNKGLPIEQNIQNDVRIQQQLQRYFSSRWRR